MSWCFSRVRYSTNSAIMQTGDVRFVNDSFFWIGSFQWTAQTFPNKPNQRNEMTHKSVCSEARIWLMVRKVTFDCMSVLNLVIKLHLIFTSKTVIHTTCAWMLDCCKSTFYFVSKWLILVSWNMANDTLNYITTLINKRNKQYVL